MLKAGVVFPNGFALIRDVVAIDTIMKKHPTCFAWGTCVKEKLGV